MVCIHVPVFEHNAAEKNRAKSRCLSAANAPPPALREAPGTAAAAVTGQSYRDASVPPRLRSDGSLGFPPAVARPNACSSAAVDCFAVVLPGQRSLFASGEVRVDQDARWERLALEDTSWVDVCRSHLLGADTVLDAVIDAVPWQCGRRRMYDRMVDDPRLSYRAPRPEAVPHPVL